MYTSAWLGRAILNLLKSKEMESDLLSLPPVMCRIFRCGEVPLRCCHWDKPFFYKKHEPDPSSHPATNITRTRTSSDTHTTETKTSSKTQKHRNRDSIRHTKPRKQRQHQNTDIIRHTNTQKQRHRLDKDIVRNTNNRNRDIIRTHASWEHTHHEPKLSKHGWRKDVCCDGIACGVWVLPTTWVVAGYSCKYVYDWQKAFSTFCLYVVRRTHHIPYNVKIWRVLCHTVAYGYKCHFLEINTGGPFITSEKWNGFLVSTQSQGTIPLHHDYSSDIKYIVIYELAEWNGHFAHHIVGPFTRLHVHCTLCTKLFVHFSVHRAIHEF